MGRQSVGGLIGVPQLQEHEGEVPGAVPLQPHAGVFPVAKAHLLVDVLVGNVDAASEGNLAVDHQNFPVVPVVHGQRKHRNEPVESHALYAVPFQLGLEVLGQNAQAAHVVVHQAHVHALGRLAHQYAAHGLPHFALGKDEVFQINGFLGLLQVLQHGGKQLFANGVVGHAGVLLQGVWAALADVAGCGAHTGMLGLQRGNGLLIGCGEQRFQRRAGLGQGMAHPAGGLLVAQNQVQQPAEQRGQRDENDPQQLVGGVFVPLNQKQDGQQAQQAE